MRVAILHSSISGFFPRFYAALHASIVEQGNECRLFVPQSKTNRRVAAEDKYIFGFRSNTFIHQKLYALTGLQDIFSIFSTIALIHALKKYKADVLHCHLFNGKYICLPLLLSYAAKEKLPIVGTMHDCSAFTGRCAYYDEINCSRWQSGCGDCPQKQLYNPTWIDNSKLQWQLRQKWAHKYQGVNLTIVTPSQWLSDEIGKSFLRHYMRIVIPNGIDIEQFGSHQEACIAKQLPNDKKIVLGLAHAWEERKGLSVFKRLAKDLPSDYQVVLAGHLPEKIENTISFPPTTDVNTLTTLYQNASVFVNPTMADNFPTTHLEALACGTPVVTYQTGGSMEALDEHSGIAVPRGDYQALLAAVQYVCENIEQYNSSACKERARLFSTTRYDEYVTLYKQVIAFSRSGDVA